MLKKYFWNILIALDQLVNTLLGGDPSETMSSRMGKLVLQWKTHPELKGRYIIAIIICRLLSYIQNNHCIDSIEPDRGSRDIWNK